MKPLALTLCLYAFAHCSAANPITTTAVSCSAYGFTPVSNPASCAESSTGNPNVYGSGSVAVASSSAQLDLPTDYTGGTLSQMAGSRGDQLSGSSWRVSQASSSGEIQLDNLYTTGPVRPGFLQVYFSSSDLTGYNFTGSATFSIGSSSGGCRFGEDDFSSCNLAGIDLPILQHHAFLFPFTLGQSFDYYFSQSLLAFADQQTGATQGTVDTSFGFLLTEADGTTLVSVFSVPEPATWMSLTVGSITLLALRRRPA